MADRVLMPRAFDSNGDIVTDATAYFYEVGTTTPLIVYTDSDGTVPLGTSAEGYADGSFDGVFTTEPLRMDMQNGAGVSLPGFPSDGWYVVPANGVGAGTITFEPQEGNTATNVQAAINNLTALWVAVTTYGKSLIAAADAAAAQETLGLGDNALLDFADLTNTTAEWQAGTATDYGYITPAQLKAAIRALSVTPTFTSTVAWGATVVSAAHGLGAVPSRWRVLLVCTTIDQGYAVGDILDVTANNEGSGARGNTASANATAIQLAGNSIYVTPKAGGAVAVLTTTSWQVRFEAWA